MKIKQETAPAQGALRRKLLPRREHAYDSSIHGCATGDTKVSRTVAAPPIRVDQWAIDTVLDRLDGCRPSGDGYTARCPAHADINPSLSICDIPTGQVLVYCHAGCDIDAILAAVGLKRQHLFTSEYARRFGARRMGRTLTLSASARAAHDNVINYEKIQVSLKKTRVIDDDAFMPLCLATYLSVRACVDFDLGFDGSAFAFTEYDSQMRPVGIVYRSLDGKKWSETGSARGLTIPSVNRCHSGKIYVAEGATDAMAMHMRGVRAIGRPCAMPSARATAWLTEYLQRHAGEGFVVVGDNDTCNSNGKQIGQEAARDLAKRLARDVAGKVPVAWALPQPEFKDVRDQIIHGAWKDGLIVQEVIS